ncbi:dihydroneopterin aldolase 2-like [Papaver somniferum]|uniref:dihydroneopterin aldolase 2-like n=1 Tax=Papaver somniferum TaxID=3469 RepID=UPI000E70415A|nr:dihydroneopterin aldolase 2-like [Papaver somniferum]
MIKLMVFCLIIFVPLIFGILQQKMETDCMILKGDKLILRGMMFHGYHGVLPEEKTLGQKFVIDMDAWVDLREPGKSDNINDSVSYVDLYNIVKDVVEGPGFNLLETVAHLIATKTLERFSQISTVRVKLGKPHMSIQGPVDYLGIEIFRSSDFMSNTELCSSRSGL